MSEPQPEFWFRLKLPQRPVGGSVVDWLEVTNQTFYETAHALAARLDEHGVSDGYEISCPTTRWMKVKASTPQCALFLLCWDEHDSRTPPLPGSFS